MKQKSLDPSIELRPLSHDDQETVWCMLMHAAHETDLEYIKSSSLLVPYAQDFGRQTGDMGVLAVDTSRGDKNISVGAAWVRTFSNSGLAAATGLPELAIACLHEYRGRGIGTALLDALLKVVPGPGVCLSCREGNAAIRLYERAGFVKVPGSEQPNRVGGTSVTMTFLSDN